MKKLVCLLLVLAMVATLFVGCAETKPGNETKAPDGTQGAEPAKTDAPAQTDAKVDGGDMKVAFVTDVGNIDDHSFNQYTYEGVTRFGKASGCDVTYYKPSEDTDQSREDAINQAIKDGFKTIVMAGFLFGPACNTCALANPDVNFLALDVSEGDLKADTIPANVALVIYKEEQCGYLAGYAAVIDGYEKLGFLGGMSVPAVVRYGQGFVQGANAAAEKLGKTVEIKYWYSGSFAPTDEIASKMDTWYAEGTQVVFACGGGIYLSCLTAAEANNGLMIGVDVDQSNESEVIITSAMKALSNSVLLSLTQCAENGWKWPEAYAGKCQSLGAESDCVGLPMETSKFKTFTKENYDELFKGIVDGSIKIDNNSDPDKHPETPNVNVDWQ
ncbi:MAG: BMP family ABC transporter substrate-binding protein [Oscillospiraceae bacterium]|nr:BMP family ABC transporter substrate-binding protein [Oscillospiraceae bacterium]